MEERPGRFLLARIGTLCPVRSAHGLSAGDATTQARQKAHFSKRMCFGTSLAAPLVEREGK